MISISQNSTKDILPIIRENVLALPYITLSSLQENQMSHRIYNLPTEEKMLRTLYSLKLLCIENLAFFIKIQKGVFLEMSVVPRQPKTV